MSHEIDIPRQVQLERQQNGEFSSYFEAVLESLRNKLKLEGNSFINTFDSRFVNCIRKTTAGNESFSETYSIREYSFLGSTTAASFRIVGKRQSYGINIKPEYLFVGRHLSFGWPGEIPRELSECSNRLVEENPPKERDWIHEYAISKGDVKESLAELFRDISVWEPYDPYKVVNSKFRKGNSSDYVEIEPGISLSFLKPIS